VTSRPRASEPVKQRTLEPARGRDYDREQIFGHINGEGKATVAVESGLTQGMEILRLARTWSTTLDNAGEAVPRINQMRERMFAPQPNDVVVDAGLLDPGSEYQPHAVGFLVGWDPDGSAVIRSCDDASVETRIGPVELVAVPGLGPGWPA
jgi:hypothetical protein